MWTSCSNNFRPKLLIECTWEEKWHVMSQGVRCHIYHEHSSLYLFTELLCNRMGYLEENKKTVFFPKDGLRC